MRLKLPNLPGPTWGNNTAYSNQYGLFSVGGQTAGNEVFNLTTQNDGTLMWNKLKNDMQNRHYYPSVCTVNDDKLFVAAGDNSPTVNDEDMDSKIEMCDLKTQKWIQLADCTIKRSIAGIFYDSIQQTVYLGGGNNKSRTIECYDMNKNKWRLLPECNLKHRWNPAIWKDDMKDLLCIASIEANAMEYIDLRENYATWTVKYGQSESTPELGIFEKAFGTTFTNPPQKSWLLPLIH